MLWLTREQLLALLESSAPEVRAAFSSLDFDDAVHPDAVIWTTPERHSGDPCFAGTRVPVSICLALRQNGLGEFLTDYPSMQRQPLGLRLADQIHRVSRDLRLEHGRVVGNARRPSSRSAA